MESSEHKHLAFIVSSCTPLFFLLFIFHQILAVKAQNVTPAPVRVGVVLDLNSIAGIRSKTSISMAIEDFYAVNADFNTRVVLEYRDSMSDVVSAASAGLDLLMNSEVQAIIGPQTSTETVFIANMCNQSHVPLLSFSVSSPTISSSHLPFFVRATTNDSSQTIPIAAFIQYFNWRNVIPIYEDSEFGSGIIPCLVDALRSVGTKIPDRVVIPTEATDDRIDTELSQLMTLQTQVFIIHMLPKLASRLFLRAQVLGLMSVGYVWIVTDSVSNILETLDPDVVLAMEGVIGFRPYVAYSDEIHNFSTRFKARLLQDNPGMGIVDPTVYQFWAYDAVWAMATAVEMANTMDPRFELPQSGTTDSVRIRVSQTGDKLLCEILDTKFDGLTGKFRLVDNQIQLSAFEIVNVVGKSAQVIGLWTPEKGIIRIMSEINSSFDNDNNNNSLKSIIWPGHSTEEPKGWVVTMNGNVLRILVPVKHGRSVFVNISGPIEANVPISDVTGYCIDVFNAVLSKLPYPVYYEFYPFSSDSYDNLVYQVYLNNYDAVVGDTTIRFNRTAYVDFTMPYTESGVSMVVPIKSDASNSIWIFLKPLTATLWLTSLVFFFFTGFVVWLIEHRINPEFRGKPSHQFGLIFYFAFSTLVFAHKEKLESNLSRCVVIIWVFVVLILTSSYTASLTSMLTVQQLTRNVTDVNQIIKQGDYVGYPDGSFVKGLLINLGFDENKLKNYSTYDEYALALLKGSANGGIAAFYDEIPYLKVFLSRYCNQYTMTGPTYRTDGFGFVFPIRSPLLSDMSKAVLTVKEGEEMIEIEKKWFGNSTMCPSQSTDHSSSSLSFQSFAGLFVIIGSVSGLMLLSYLAMFIYKEKDELISMVTPDRSIMEILKLWVGYYDGIDRNSPPLGEYINSSMSTRWNQEGNLREVNLAGFMVLQTPDSISNLTSEMNFASQQEGILTAPDSDSASPSNESQYEEQTVEFTVQI